MPVFNAYEKTNPRLKKSKPFSEGVSAGAAKVSSRGGKSREELKNLGERNGWTVRELSMREIQQMSADEAVWQETFNKESFDKAFERDAVAGERKNINAQWAAKKIWDDVTKPTPEQSDAILAALERFKQTYSQFIQSRAENGIILTRLKERNLHVTFENLVESFEANALEGKIWLNPNAINAGAETEVSGQQLLNHHNFSKLILPQQRISETDRMSANEFYEQNKEILADRRTPPIIQARNAKAASTAAHFQQTETSTAKSGSTSVTDYGHEQHGVPPSSEKYSFQRLINSLSAEDFARRVKEDPQFAAAIDKLNSK
jgi:hypothetical protein